MILRGRRSVSYLPISVPVPPVSAVDGDGIVAGQFANVEVWVAAFADAEFRLSPGSSAVDIAASWSSTTSTARGSAVHGVTPSSPAPAPQTR